MIIQVLMARPKDRVGASGWDFDREIMFWYKLVIILR